MSQLEELKLLRIDREPPADGLERAVGIGGRRRRRAQRISIASLCAVAVLGVAVPVAWPTHSSDESRVSAGPTTPVPSTAATNDPADQALRQVTTIPATTFGRVATSGVTQPTVVSGTPLTFDGKPGVFWYGAEYAPYAAAQRWALVIALSRFGTWSGLHTTTSSATDVYPNTASFTFYGARYTSAYLTFQSVETAANHLTGNTYAPLQTPTAEQTALVDDYDQGAAIPFIDFGNKSVLIGSSYDTGLLQGKSLEEIAAAATDPSTQLGRAILTTANMMTSAICGATGAQPATVCGSLPH